MLYIVNMDNSEVGQAVGLGAKPRRGPRIR